MHTDAPDEQSEPSDSEELSVPIRARASSYRGTAAEDKELMAIFEKTYGKIKRRTAPERVENEAPAEKEKRKKPPKRTDDYLIIDGYNFIHAHPELSRLAASELSHAREALIRLVCNYQGYKKCRAIIVFDAYKRRGGEGSVESYGEVSVVYTKERQTADAYIEKTAYELGDKHSVRVVTSDYEEQLVILGAGALRVSCREFIEELATSADEIRDIIG
jgi:predicted RNA-binding protein with PIN domain